MTSYGICYTVHLESFPGGKTLLVVRYRSLDTGKQVLSQDHRETIKEVKQKIHFIENFK